MTDFGHPLAIATSMAVPLLIHDIGQRGGPTEADFEEVRSFGQVLAEKGDVLLYRGKKKGESAALFNRLVRAIAIMSFCPGGVKIFDNYYLGHVPGDVRRWMTTEPTSSLEWAALNRRRSELIQRRLSGPLNVVETEEFQRLEELSNAHAATLSKRGV